MSHLFYAKGCLWGRWSHTLPSQCRGEEDMSGSQLGAAAGLPGPEQALCGREQLKCYVREWLRGAGSHDATSPQDLPTAPWRRAVRRTGRVHACPPPARGQTLKTVLLSSQRDRQEVGTLEGWTWLPGGWGWGGAGAWGWALGPALPLPTFRAAE